MAQVPSPSATLSSNAEKPQPPRRTTSIWVEQSVANLDDFLEITSYEQMRVRPRFDPCIDSRKVKPVRPLGHYPGLAQMIQCGRSGCRQWQKVGWLVECDNGRETNIGEECGEKILGVSWKEFIGSAQSIWRQKRTLEDVRAAVARAPEYLRRLDDLINQPLGLKLLHESMVEFDRSTPHSIVNEVKRRADRDETRVTIVRRRSYEELEVYDLTNAPPELDQEDLDENERRRIRNQYEGREDRNWLSEDIGALVGLRVFRFNYRAATFVELKPGLEKLAATDADKASWRERRAWEAWVRDLEGRFLGIEQWIADGISFFGTQSNFDLMPHLARDEKERTRMQSVTWDLERGVWCSKSSGVPRAPI